MDKLAELLNETLETTSVYSMLSDYGKRMYVPKGIIVQSTEAKKKATKYNATIGVAMDHGSAMYINGIKKQFSETLKPSELFPYAPMGGVPALRQVWQEKMLEKNPLLEGKKIALPVVCSGLTNALSIVFSLFADKDDEVVMPNLYWENYDLIIGEQRQAKKVLFNLFDNEGFNTKGLDEAISSTKNEKIIVFLNFPNNPTGYTPTDAESDEIARILKKHADNGKKIVLVSDDAYFGLFFEENVCRQSLFAKVCDLSENILAIKCDAATKEEMVWGFRIAFITYSFKGCTDETIDCLVQKTMGVIRGSISSCSLPSQSIILKGLTDPDFFKDKEKGVNTIAERYRIFKNALKAHSDSKYIRPLPFNSGYFMSFETKRPAEDLRQLLLENGIGTIRQGDHILRIAFSSVDAENIEDLVNSIYSAAETLA